MKKAVAFFHTLVFIFFACKIVFTERKFYNHILKAINIKIFLQRCLFDKYWPMMRLYKEGKKRYRILL